MPFCSLCPGRSFVDDNAVRMHRESRHSWTCDDCDKVLNSQQALDQHVRDKHPSFECEYCDLEFSTDQGRLAHEGAKHPSTFECEYCDREFKSEQARQQHEDAKHSFERHYCDDELGTEAARQQHEDIHHPSTFECEYCDREFKSEQARQQHEDAKHSFERHYCDDELGTEAARQQHEDTEHAPTFECEYCDREFSTDEGRLAHETAKHMRTFVGCEYCDREFKTDQARQQHIDVKHSFRCRYCSREFSSEDLWRAHEVAQHPPEDRSSIRSQIWPHYDCTYCKKEFSINTLKVSHEMSCIFRPADHGTSLATERVDEESSPSVATQHTEGGSEPSASPRSAQSTIEGEMFHSTSALSSADANGEGRTDSLDHGMDKDDIKSVVSAHESNDKEDHRSAIFQCVPCLGIFESEAAFQDHVCGFRSTILRPQCTMCYSQFDDAALLQEHMGGLRSFSCQLCRAQCCSDEMLQDHLLSHPTCGKCNKSFADNLALCAHVESDHPVVVCWDCDGIVVENSSLELHYADSSVHPSCALCGVGKRNAVDMDEHIRHDHATSGEMPGTDNVNSSPDEDVPSTETQPPRAEEDVTGRPLANGAEEQHDGLVSQIGDAAGVDDEVGVHQYASPSPTPSEHGSDASRSQLQTSPATCTATNNPLSPVSSVSAASFSDLSTTSSSSNSVVFVSADGIPGYVRESRAVLVATSAGSPSSGGTPLSSSPSRFDVLNARTREARTSNLNDASANASRTGRVTHRVHCRICFRDPCEDMTATLCGHLFCNTCITRAVVAKSECPACKSATLLYCLFKLDLSI